MISCLCAITRQVARSMISDAIDQVDELEQHEHVLIDALRDTFEMLRQQYYESASLGDGYDFGRISSGAYFLVNLLGVCTRTCWQKHTGMHGYAEYRAGSFRYLCLSLRLLSARHVRGCYRRPAAPDIPLLRSLSA